MMTLLAASAFFFAVSLSLAYGLSAVLSSQAAIIIGYGAGLLAFLAGLGGVGVLRGARPLGGGDWRRYFQISLDHKVVGVQYFAVSMAMFVLSGAMALMMRAELARPGLQFLTETSYPAIVTIHGLGMSIAALTAIVGGIGSFATPLMIGAERMAFPRLNALSVWILPPAVVLLLAALGLGGMNTGWAGPVFGEPGNTGKIVFLLGFLTVEVSAVLSGLNGMATILTLRTKAMTLGRLPIFAWSQLAVGVMVSLVSCGILGGLVLVSSDYIAGTSFLRTEAGGVALLYRHVQWFYYHPMIYIMTLPAMGLILEILPVFSGKPLFGYRLAAGALFGAILLNFVDWTHHAFINVDGEGLPKVISMVITQMSSMPIGALMLCAFGTLWMGSLRLRVPMLFALAFLIHFIIAALSGMFLTDMAIYAHLHDTLFTVAHFHFATVGGVVFAFFSGAYYYFPKITGRMYDETLGKIHFWIFVVGFNAVFIPMSWLGARGIPRHTADYLPQFGPVQFWMSVGGFVTAAGVAVFIYNVVRSCRTGLAAPGDPWNAATLEWRKAPLSALKQRPA